MHPSTPLLCLTALSRRSLLRTSRAGPAGPAAAAAAAAAPLPLRGKPKPKGVPAGPTLLPAGRQTPPSEVLPDAVCDGGLPPGVSDGDLSRHLQAVWGPRATTAASDQQQLRLLYRDASADMRRIAARGGEVGVMCYRAMMHTFSRSAECVEQLYDAMLQQGIRPQDTAVLAVLRAYALQRNATKLQATFSQAAHHRPTLPEPLLLVYVYGLLRCGLLHEARSFVDSMPAVHGVSPGVISHTMLMRYADSAEDVERHMQCIRAASSGGTADALAHRNRVEALCRLGLLEEAEESLQGMQREGVRYGVGVYQALMAAEGGAARFVRLWQAVDREGLRHDGTSLSVMLKFVMQNCRRQDDSYAGLARRVFFSKGMPRGLRTSAHYILMLRIYARTGDYAAAEDLRQGMVVRSLGTDVSSVVCAAYAEASYREDHPAEVPLLTRRVAVLDTFAPWGCVRHEEAGGSA